MQLEKSVQAARPPTGLVYATDIGAFGLVQVSSSGEFQMLWLVSGWVGIVLLYVPFYTIM